MASKGGKGKGSGKGGGKEATVQTETISMPKTQGRGAKEGDTVRVHYTGTLAANGKKFDSSIGKQPLEFVLGRGKVIKGWHLGIAGMCLGEKRRLTIPAALAYGAQAVGGGLIPPNSDLVFEVELVGLSQ
jgi:FKBP-type peptidyl-prolyl cis-trans isomerase